MRFIGMVEKWVGGMDFNARRMATITDAPLPDETVMIMAIADGGRVDPRFGSGPVKD